MSHLIYPEDCPPEKRLRKSPQPRFRRRQNSFSSTENLPAFLTHDRDHETQDFRASLETAIVALGYFALFCVIMGACTQADRLYSLVQGLSQ